MDNIGQQWTTMDNNGQQSAVLHESLMPFFVHSVYAYKRFFIFSNKRLEDTQAGYTGMGWKSLKASLILVLKTLSKSGDNKSTERC